MINLNEPINVQGYPSLDWHYVKQSGEPWANTDEFINTMNSKGFTIVTGTTILVMTGSGYAAEYWNPTIANTFIRKQEEPESFSVVDSLNSDDPANALSARQGKALKGMVDELLPQSTTLAEVATSGNYNHLIGTPLIPVVEDKLDSTMTTNALSANQGRVLKNNVDSLPELGDLSEVAKSGSYEDLLEKPEIPTESLRVEDKLSSIYTTRALSANQGNVLNIELGALSSLNTGNKTNLVAAINELTARIAALEGTTPSVTSYPTTFSIVHATLTNQPTSVVSGSEFVTVVGAESGYHIDSVTVKMGGTDITASSWNASTKTIRIASVTSYVDIDVTASSTSSSDWSVNWSLYGMTSTSSVATVANGGSLEATLTLSAGFKNPTVTVKMGGTDITSSAYNEATGRLFISPVTGGITVTTDAEVDTPGYTPRTQTLLYNADWLDSTAMPTVTASLDSFVSQANDQIHAFDPDNKYLKIAVITDTHAVGTTAQESQTIYYNQIADNNIALFGRLINETDVKAGFILGDYYDNRVFETVGKAKYSEEMKRIVNMIRNSTPGPVFFTMGNHEIGGNKTAIYSGSEANEFIQTINRTASGIYPYYMNTSGSSATFGYVVEFPEYKIKVAMADEVEKGAAVLEDSFGTTPDGWTLVDMWHGVGTGGALIGGYNKARDCNFAAKPNLTLAAGIRGHVHGTNNNMNWDISTKGGNYYGGARTITTSIFSLPQSFYNQTETFKSDHICISIFIFNTDTKKTHFIRLGRPEWYLWPGKAEGAECPTFPVTADFATHSEA